MAHTPTHKTGIYAPRYTGTADRMERGGVPTLPATTTTAMPTGAFTPTPSILGNFPYAPATYTGMGQISPQDQGNALADKILAGMGIGGGGGGGNKYTDAIKFLQKQLKSGEYGQSYDSLSTLLGSTADTARSDIDAGSLAAITAMSKADPMAGFQFNTDAVQIPQTALSNYLTDIGASTQGVDAGQQFMQQLLNAQMAGVNQYQQGAQQGFDLTRESARNAVLGNQAYSQGQLGIYQQAQQMAINQAKEKERKSLNDQILQYILRGGKA